MGVLFCIKWNKIRIDDDCKGTIKYYVNDDLIATIGIRSWYLDDFDPLFDGENFYKKAVIRIKTATNLQAQIVHSSMSIVRLHSV